MTFVLAVSDSCEYINAYSFCLAVCRLCHHRHFWADGVECGNWTKDWKMLFNTQNYSQILHCNVWW